MAALQTAIGYLGAQRIDADLWAVEDESSPTGWRAYTELELSILGISLEADLGFVITKRQIYNAWVAVQPMQPVDHSQIAG